MRWPITILVSFIAPLAVAQEKPPLASVPPVTPTAGFRTADVEGQTLRYYCQGIGSPTVIIEQGGGISLETVFSWKQPVGWADLAPKIASLTRVCVYDRVGLGRSSKAERPRTSFDVAAELHTLLARENIAPPYVLAGQSLGGMNALAFASQYRDEVIGLVLIDSSHPQQLQRINAALPPRRNDESEVLRGFRDGPNRTAMGGEWFDFVKNGEQFTNNMSIGNIPLIVLTAAPQLPTDKSPLPRDWQIAIEPVHQQLQRELAKVSTDSKHIVARKAGHNIQLDEPELVLDAIASLVMRARAGPSGVAAATARADITAFVHVTVVPMDRERVLKNWTVVVSQGRIRELGPSSAIKIPKEATLVHVRFGRDPTKVQPQASASRLTARDEIVRSHCAVRNTA